MKKKSRNYYIPIFAGETQRAVVLSTKGIGCLSPFMPTENQLKEHLCKEHIKVDDGIRHGIEYRPKPLVIEIPFFEFESAMTIIRTKVSGCLPFSEICCVVEYGAPPLFIFKCEYNGRR